MISTTHKMLHPAGEMILFHLLRYRLIAVENYSVTACALQLKQNHFVKYPDYTAITPWFSVIFSIIYAKPLQTVSTESIERFAFTD